MSLVSARYDAQPARLDSFPTRRSSDLARERAAALRQDIEPDPRCGERRPAAVLRDVRQPLAEPSAELRQHSLGDAVDRKSTRLNSSHLGISYAVFCLKKNIAASP